MSAANVTQSSPLLKRLYPEGTAFPAFKKSKFLAKAKTDTKFGGLGKQVNVTIAPTTGGSASFAEALASQAGTTERNFFLVHRKEYQVGSIQGDLIQRSMGDKNVIVEAIKHQLDKARYAFSRSLARRAWGNGGGSLGQINSATTTDTVTLQNRADIVGFFAGMQVQTASDDGSAVSPAGLNDSGRKLTLTSVNKSTGTLTANANWNTIVGTVTAHYIFRAGDYSVAMSGVRGWLPITAPTTGDSFMSLDRFASGDIDALSGTRVTSAGNKEDTLINATAEAALRGFDVGECWVNPLDMKDLLKEVGTKRIIEGKTNVPGISFRGVEIDTANGVIVVISEADVPQGYFWMFTTNDVWTLRTAGECPMFLNKLGTGPGMLLVAADDDAYQFRLGAYGNFENSNPGEGIIGTF